jgi:putative ABC transport system permease protein
MFYSGFLRDVCFAVRGLVKTPGVAAVVVWTLAVAIGANTVIFSVVQSVLLRPLPYPDEDRIVRVAPTVYPSKAGNVTDRGNPFSPRGYRLFVNDNRSFESFGGYLAQSIQYPLTGEGPPRQVNVGLMTRNAFEVLGVLPERGRLPSAEEDAPGGPLVALLSHGLWASQYGADPAIVGRTIHLNGTSREVIGVMPAGYDFPSPELDVWIPFQLDPASNNFGAHFIFAIARLAPGVTIKAAARDARSLVARFDEVGYDASWFKEIFDGGAVVRPLRDYVVGDARRPLLIVLATAGFVLLIACSNVANLLLVRAEGRRRENALRMALGSSRGRLARHMLVESAVLAFVGGAAGVLLAFAGIRALVSIGPASIPRLDEIGINGTALGFTLLVSVLAGLMFGVLPAMHSSSTQTMAAIRDGGRGTTLGRERHRTRNALVLTQVALAFVLVAGSGLMVRSFQALRSVEPGFTAAGVLTFDVRPLPTKYESPEAVAQFYDRLIERLEAVPGVRGAGAVDKLPLNGTRRNFAAVVDEFPPAKGEFPPLFEFRRVTPGYFRAMGIPVIEGRTFTSVDSDARLGRLVISESVKARYWPDTSALGKGITISGVPARVVGVVGDVHDTGLDAGPDQFLYLPMLSTVSTGAGSTAMTMTVRTATHPLSSVPAIRGAIAELDPDLPIAQVQPMQRVLDHSMSRTSFTMSLLVIAAIVALFLGAIGIYGVLSYVVSQRVTEIGVRTALGASPGKLLGMVLSQGMRLAGVGVLIGLIAALALGRAVAALLYGVGPMDPGTLVAASALFLAVAGLASLLPASRAAAAAPTDALRIG